MSKTKRTLLTDEIQEAGPFIGKRLCRIRHVGDEPAFEFCFGDDAGATSGPMFTVRIQHTEESLQLLLHFAGEWEDDSGEVLYEWN